MTRSLRLYRLVATAQKRAGGDKNEIRLLVEPLVDAANLGRCVYSGTKLGYANMSLDHKTPISRGGVNEADNLQIICKRCNQAKGSFTDQEFFAILKAVEPFEKYCRQYLYTRLMAATRIFRRWKR